VSHAPTSGQSKATCCSPPPSFTFPGLPLWSASLRHPLPARGLHALATTSLLPAPSAFLGPTCHRSMFCYEFFILYFYELFIFCCWVLVYVGNPFSRAFVQILVVPTPIQPLQMGYCFHFQLNTRLSTSAKGLCFLTSWKALSKVMPLLFTVLVLYPFYADQSLALSKVNRTEIFLIPLK